MPYVQTREESAALLKRVIAEMGQHLAPFHPASFAVWYEHFAGINPALSRALEQARLTQPQFTTELIDQLHRDHVAEPDDEASKQVQGQFEKVMSAVAEQAAATGRDADVYSSQLEGLSRALKAEDGSKTSPALTPRLSDAAAGTNRMQHAVAEMARTVADSQSEIERLRQALDRSRVEAITDPLSQVLNRKGFDEAVRKALGRPAAAGRAHCLVMVDIDHFKVINDTYGHPVGDTVIQTLAQLLKRLAGGPGLAVARVGGEEFAVFMADATLVQATQLAQAARALVSATRIRRRGTQETIATVTISAGVAACLPGDDAGSLVAAADAALYRSKQAGRDRVTVA